MRVSEGDTPCSRMAHDADTLDDGPPAFLPSISDFWHPSARPEFEASLRGWPLYFYLLLRKIYVYLLLPFRALLIVLGVPIGPTRPSWTTKQKIVIPFLNHQMWSIRGLGSPPRQSFDDLREVPPSAERRYGKPRKDDPHGVTADQLDLPLMDSDRAKRWYIPASEGGVLDPKGIVQPHRVPTYTFWREPLEYGGTAFSLAREGERVILYLVGGGYVEGSPMEERVWNVCRRTGLRVIGP